jgi:hypothetical protein
MQQSEEVRDAMLHFCARLSAGDVASFDELVSQEPATLIIGTGPGEWVTERERLRFGFEAEGVRLEAKRSFQNQRLMLRSMVWQKNWFQMICGK